MTALHSGGAAMPGDPSSLERLARQHGIQPSYADVWGRERKVSAPALAALLAALSVDDPATAPADRVETAPPVVVVGSGQTPWHVLLRIPPSTRSVSWILTLENGAGRSGAFDTEPCWDDEAQNTSGPALRTCRARFEEPLEPGYHQLSFDGLDTSVSVIAAPGASYAVAQAGTARVWGPAVQLYALRSERNWGIGDFADLRALAVQWSRFGAGIVGVNPLHALFSRTPEHASPYSPSSRLWLNPLYLAIDEMADFAECEAAAKRVGSDDFRQQLSTLRESHLVDYTGVASVKLEILELLHGWFRERHLSLETVRGQQFKAFQRSGGQALRRHATFEALDGHFQDLDPHLHGWRRWPATFHDPASAMVAAFVVQHPQQVEFHEYLQWQVALQLAELRAAYRELGMPVGLYLDLAVSVDPNGSDAWSHADLYATSAGVGAPPDEFNPKGQGWGLAPLRPEPLRAEQHRLFIETVSRTMEVAGAIRIDHVMGLMRLFWVPQGMGASEGAYVHYPFDELLAIVRLESQRHATLVIGEDLGTVDPAVREALSESGILSYRLVYFERKQGGDFKPAHEYPAQALAAISTHDLATFAGWWTGRDLASRRALDLFPDLDVFRKQSAERVADRVRLVTLLRHAGLLPDADAAALEPLGEAAPSAALVEAIHVFLGRTPAQVIMVQMEDVTGVVEQANMPGTTDEHPNWRRKLPVGEATASVAAQSLLRAVDASRAIGR